MRFLFYILLSFYITVLFYVKPSFGMRCPCDMQNVKREKNMFFLTKFVVLHCVPPWYLASNLKGRIREKTGNTSKTQDFKRQQRCNMNPHQKKYLISNTQTYLIETLCMQGSTLHLVISENSENLNLRKFKKKWQ